MLSVYPLPTLLRRFVGMLIVALATVFSSACADVSAPVEVTQPDTSQQRLDDERHSYEIRVIDRLLEQFHYKQFHLDDELSKVILQNYLDSLDPARMFFIASDIAEIKKLESNFDDYIRRGVTAAYLSIFSIYQKRVEERVDYALMLLDQQFNFEADESFELDRSETPWAKDDVELDTLWHKRIKNDLINLSLTGEEGDEALETLRKRYNNILKSSKQIKDNEIFQIYVNAYASAIEPHTGYFSPRATEEFNISMRLSLQGIGAVLRSEDDYTKIVSVVPGGPADQSGQLHAEDKILAVAQGDEGELVDIFGWRLSDVVDIIRGPKGSTVRLLIQPAEMGADAPSKEVSMVRDNIKLESQAAKSRTIEVKTDTGAVKLGVIVLPSFYIDFEARSKGDEDYRSTTRDVARLIEALKADQVDGIIIDLRGNGGGSLEEVVTLTGLFIDKGPVVQVQNSAGRVQVHRDKESGALYSGPLAVMVDRQSASASEIFAGALQDYRRGIIIGETTFGKGTVQNVLPLNAYAREQFKDQLGQLKITIAQFFRVNGDSTQHRGVIPDISWPFAVIDDEPYGERALKNALPWQQIKQVDFEISAFPVDSDVLGQLRTQHQARIEEDAAFVAELNKFDLLAKSRQEKSVSLNKEQRRVKRETFNQQLLAAENEIRLANNKSPYESIKQMREDQEKQRNESSYRNDREIEPDPFMYETANILADLKQVNLVRMANSVPSTARK